MVSVACRGGKPQTILEEAPHLNNHSVMEKKNKRPRERMATRKLLHSHTHGIHRHYVCVRVQHDRRKRGVCPHPCHHHNRLARHAFCKRGEKVVSVQSGLGTVLVACSISAHPPISGLAVPGLQPHAPEISCSPLHRGIKGAARVSGAGNKDPINSERQPSLQPTLPMAQTFLGSLLKASTAFTIVWRGLHSLDAQILSEEGYLLCLRIAHYSTEDGVENNRE